MRTFTVLILLCLFPVVLFAQVARGPAMTPLNSRAGEATLFALQFTAQDTIPADARFVLTFPKGFGLEMLSLAGSSVMKGGFTVQVKGQQVTISRRGEGQAILPGTTVDLKFSLVKNPPQGGEYTISWQVLRRDGTALGAPNRVAVRVQ